jgi:hypothetical protein
MKAEGVATGAGLGVAGTAGISNEVCVEIFSKNKKIKIMLVYD